MPLGVVHLLQVGVVTHRLQPLLQRHDLVVAGSSICTQHHLHGIHEGRIRAHGRAPDDITWELGVRSDGSAHLTVQGRTIVAEVARQEVCA